MATTVITYEVIPTVTCPTGNHGTIAIKQDNVIVKEHKNLTWDQIKDIEYNNEDLLSAFFMLAREMVKRAGVTTKAAVVNKVNSMSITLTY